MASIDFSKEIKRDELFRDTRKFSQKAEEFLGETEGGMILCIGLAALSVMLPALIEIFFVTTVILFFLIRRARKKKGMPMHLPKSSGEIDSKELHPGTGKPMPAEGIVFIGNDMHSKKEVWLTDTQARVHMLFLGTTGSGKAQSENTLVLTPLGWKPLGELQEADVVCIPNGETANVIGVFPQGYKTQWQLHMRDNFGNRFSEKACDDHLWTARVSATAELKDNPTGVDTVWQDRICTTDELRKLNSDGYLVKLPITDILSRESDTTATGIEYATGTQYWVTLSRISKGKQERCLCIKLNSKESLYVTKGEGTLLRHPETNDLVQFGVVTHNTEFLISVVYNGLIHGSGFIYVDGKGDAKLYKSIYSMVRAVGRDDDVLILNFQTGAKDVFGPQTSKMSNTLNIFAQGSAGMLSQAVIGLISSDKSDVWSERANSFVEAIMKPLVFLRDYYNQPLDVLTVRRYFDLKELERLALDGPSQFIGIENALSGLFAYLTNLPGWLEENACAGKGKENPEAKHESTVLEQHGYITMQLVRIFNSLADTYGYIMNTAQAEIDLTDVFLNRRILVVLLPALEKSPAELSNLGKIIVATLKATMAIGLGAQIEGETERIIDSRPTNAPSPFMCVLDEYGYYAVAGFAVVPAQARSLGFSAIFAGQDLPAFEKASKPEAQSTLANTNSKFCGKLECTETYEYFRKLAGEGTFSKVSGLEKYMGGTGMASSYRDTANVSLEKMGRVSQEDLKSHTSGRWHYFYSTTIVYLNSFYANPPAVNHLRTNYFIRTAGLVGTETTEIKRHSVWMSYKNMLNLVLARIWSVKSTAAPTSVIIGEEEEALATYNCVGLGICVKTRGKTNTASAISRWLSVPAEIVETETNIKDPTFNQDKESEVVGASDSSELVIVDNAETYDDNDNDNDNDNGESDFVIGQSDDADEELEKSAYEEGNMGADELAQAKVDLVDFDSMGFGPDDAVEIEMQPGVATENNEIKLSEAELLHDALLANQSLSEEDIYETDAPVSTPAFLSVQKTYNADTMGLNGFKGIETGDDSAYSTADLVTHSVATVTQHALNEGLIIPEEGNQIVADVTNELTTALEYPSQKVKAQLNKLATVEVDAVAGVIQLDITTLQSGIDRIRKQGIAGANRRSGR